MYRCSITADRFCRMSAAMVLLFCVLTIADDCQSSKGITSNDILVLTGNGDTLWALGWDGARSQYSINTIIHGWDSTRFNQDKNWGALSLGCISSDIYGLAFGEGRLVLCFDTVKFRQPNPVRLLRYNGNTIEHQEVNFPWSSSLKESAAIQFSATEAVWVNNAFYFACIDGGLVKWDYKNQTKTVFLPGKSESASVSDFTISGSAPDTMCRVTGVRRCGNDLLVVTPAKIWRFSTVDSSWDSSISSLIINTDIKFGSFETVYPDPYSEGVFLSRIKVKNNSGSGGSGKDTTILAKYSRSKNNWRSMLDRLIYDVVFGPGGYIFTLTEDGINAYRDTLGDSAVARTAQIDASKFNNWITQGFTIATPEISDIHYIPQTDSTGYLLVASNDGIFLAEWQFPVKDKIDFFQIKRAPQIKSGLKQTYARPGLLVADIYGREENRTVFIYNLSKDANVTIRVYDYNMDLVKTVIKNKFRRAGSNGGQHGRSTVENEDWWDGKSSAGKTVAPGVYYYRISTDIGERAFGKIVVAK